MRGESNILLWSAAALSIISCLAGCGRNPGLEPPAEKRFEITVEPTLVEFAFDESKDIDFEVTGEGAVGVEFPEITVPEGWDCRVAAFGRNADGYRGTICITAPGRESSASVQISVTNGEGVEKTAALGVRAVPYPLEVRVDVPDGPLQLKLSEHRPVPFTVTCSNPAVLTAEVSATGSWSVKLERFSGGAAGTPTDYEGSVLVMAPAESSSSEITIRIKNEAGEMVGSAKFGVRCDKGSDPDIVVGIAGRNMNFALFQTRTVEFEVRGEDARNLTASVEPPDGWSADVTFFEEYSYGYYGVLTITSPSAESEGEVVLTVAGTDGGSVSGSVGVVSEPGGLKFGDERYEFGIYEYKAITYTVTGTNGPTMEKADIICPEGWYVDYGMDGTGPSFVWDGEYDIYRGSFRIRSGAYPEESSVTVRLTDWNGETAARPVGVVCGGGDPAPAPRHGANCIVVSGAGRVSFDALRGDGTPVAGSEVKWIWADRENLIDGDSPVYASGKIIFDTAPSFSAGNMLLGLLDSSGRLVWTWHIWFATGLNLDAVSGEFMNMPLGASSAVRTPFYGIEDAGLLYQWGRKEPFPGMRDKLALPEEPSGAFRTNTRPTVMAAGYSWGITADRMDTHDKAARYPAAMAVTIADMPSSGNGLWSPAADPCPKGWRVPTRKELHGYWALRGQGGSHTGFESDGIIPDRHRGAWWSVTGLRAAGIGGNGSLQGALLMSDRLYYWSCESTGRYWPPDPGEPFLGEGYVYAYSMTNTGSHMGGRDMKKSDAMSVRCIKE